ncbi:MAG: curli production assembly/transport component CsgF [Bacteroidota bacterium]
MKKWFIVGACLFLFAGLASAQDFVYRPVNPAFGGDTFNYNWLIASAQAQDLTTDDRQNNVNDRNSLDGFTESLNRQLLSQLSRQIAVEQFGEEGLEDGTYTVGNFQIDVTSDLDGLSITIQDNSVGEQTQIFIPFF